MKLTPWFLLACLTWSSLSLAEGRVPRRRADKHDRARSAAVKGSRVQVIDDVIIVGRPQRPLAVVDTGAQRFRFAVGTARYSKSDRRFLPADTQENW